MNIDSFLIADFVQVYANKPVITGVFNIIRSREFPAAHLIMGLFISIRAHPREAGSHQLLVRLLNEQREDVIPPWEQPFTLSPDLAVSGRPLGANVARRLHGVRFEKPGHYAFEAWIDDVWMAGTDLLVQSIPS